jgi:C1A family cysteine protease
MAEKNEKVGVELGLGWLPDYPDFRDYDIGKKVIETKQEKRGVKESVNELLSRINFQESKKVSIPSLMDLRGWCPPVENQGSLGSCTANAGVGLMEYFERRAFGKHIDASRLFLYKTTRNLLHWTGDTGAFIRTTMGAMILFGVCPEEYWLYKISDFEKEPPAFCYSFAENYKTIQYYRLDPSGTSRELLLNRVKSFITAGLPSMFGFTVFNSINQAENDGKIPYPCRRDRVLGGHAVVAVGFNDEIEIENMTCEGKTTGALLIRNSWGRGWGVNGYGWLPYVYVNNGLAVDWWTLLKSEWVDTGKFQFE